MDKLEELTSSIKFDGPYNMHGHREIYDHVDALSPPDDRLALPRSLVFYAARNIISPSFIVGQIPDLLNLLAAVETYRRFAALKADEALEWHTYYEREKTHGRADLVRLLAEKEARALRRFVAKKDAQRREYLVLVRSLTQLYIHYLWTAPESCLLGKRLHDFFPGSIDGVDQPSALLFHIDLSEDEKAYLGQLKEECQNWMTLVVDWETKREEAGQEEGLSKEDLDQRYADDFRAAFPQPFEPAEMAQNVAIYVSKVEDMMRKLEAWFSPSSSSAAARV